MTDDVTICEVSDEARAALSDQFADIAEGLREALSREAMATTIQNALQPVIVALALRQRDTGDHSIH